MARTHLVLAARSQAELDDFLATMPKLKQGLAVPRVRLFCSFSPDEPLEIDADTPRALAQQLALGWQQLLTVATTCAGAAPDGLECYQCAFQMREAFGDYLRYFAGYWTAAPDEAQDDEAQDGEAEDGEAAGRRGGGRRGAGRRGRATIRGVSRRKRPPSCNRRITGTFRTLIN